MRRSGILTPIFSLPSPYGIGTMGKAAREFVDFLAQSGQSCWQLLPVGPTSFGDSPYQAFSSYAGNPYFIDLDDLVQDGLLKPEEFQTIVWSQRPDKIDYGLLHEKRFPVLRKACGRLKKTFGPEFEVFCKENRVWLEDYALFMALKGKNQGAAWPKWPKGERLRRSKALRVAKRELAEEVAFWEGVQFLFFRQWKALKTYANEKGISLFGDLPIYAALDSADVWAAPEQFQLDEDGLPTEVAGCPPDAFTADGQLWGNPLFRWEDMKKDGYAWWLRRISFQFQLYDILRIDHFRGFEAYYAIPYGDETARNGQWRPGPGLDFFKAVEQALGKREIIAEDLGFLTEEVYQLLRDTGYPGMKVLEFAFDDPNQDSEYLPYRCPAHSVVYAGTHDNDTILGWLAQAAEPTAQYAKEFLRLNETEGYHWGVLRAVWGTAAELTIVQLQDVLGLGSEARINTPSTKEGNWQWRALPDSWDEALAEKLRHEMKVYHRLVQ